MSHLPSLIFASTLVELAHNAFVIKADPYSSRADFFVEPEHLHGAVPGEKVTFRLIQWNDIRGYPQAEVLERLGRAGSNEANVLSILAEKQFSASFPPEEIGRASCRESVYVGGGEGRR